MSVLLTFLILIAPFAIAAALSWTAHRGSPMRAYLAGVAEDRDDYRVEHDLDAVRTRFERNPLWPASGAKGERR
ncbi:MAG TPA: hypothetical protein VGO30_20155 [Mycobacterium sp.]|jgi:hypothetical protein|nr:hypothetical protein [Mycobacterium sp.]